MSAIRRIQWGNVIQSQERIYYFRLGDQGSLSEKVFKVVSSVTNEADHPPPKEQTASAKAPRQGFVYLVAHRKRV